MDEKIRAGREKLEKQGHTVERCILRDITCYKIDGGTTITPKEMRETADGVYSYEELERDLLVRRRTEEEEDEQ
ncbi:MAG: hypothetical protein LAO04_13830 [Acidobacteriia bacterium]|nr:hypothetical protein [Terriglobia bacterium]